MEKIYKNLYSKIMIVLQKKCAFAKSPPTLGRPCPHPPPRKPELRGVGEERGGAVKYYDFYSV